MKYICSALFISVMSLILFACQGDEEALRENVGYLRLSLEQSKEVNTKAAAYNAKQMHVEITKSGETTPAFTTDDHTTDLAEAISLAPGEYTITAKSNGYDSESGADRAYYEGTAKVTIVKGETATATVTCSLANVKVTVAFEKTFLDKLGEGTILVQVKSKNAAAKAVDFQKNAEKQITYFPLGDLTVTYTVTTADGKKNSKEREITGVKAKDNYILNFKNAATGSGNITVTVDPSMHKYTYDFKIDPSRTSGALIAANAWSRMAYLTASEISEDVTYSQLKFQYRQSGTETWNDAETTPDETAATATATVKGLTAGTEYEYQLLDGADAIALDGTFTTEKEVALQNGNFDDWCEIEIPGLLGGKVKTAYPNASANIKFWDTSNTGANTLSTQNPTSGITNPVHTAGGKAALLESKYVMIAFAAASLYTGTFGSTNTSEMTATLNFGQPFTSRPIALNGFYKYVPQKIGNVGGNLPDNTVKEGDMDQCAIYIALAKKSYLIDNGNTKTFIDFEGDENIIAYGALPSGAATSGDDYVAFNIPLKYKNLTDQPTHIIVVCSASKYGDYMTGGTGSKLYVDDFSLVYDGEPTIWK